MEKLQIIEKQSGKIKKFDELQIIEKELMEWSSFLNIAVGVPSLAFALACISIDSYLKYYACAISILMWLSLMACAKPLFSKKLQELRARSNKDKKTEEIIKFAEKNFLSNYKFSPYFVGTLSLIAATGYCYLSDLNKIL